MKNNKVWAENKRAEIRSRADIQREEESAWCNLIREARKFEHLQQWEEEFGVFEKLFQRLVYHPAVQEFQDAYHGSHSALKLEALSCLKKHAKLARRMSQEEEVAFLKLQALFVIYKWVSKRDRWLYKTPLTRSVDTPYPQYICHGYNICGGMRCINSVCENIIRFGPSMASLPKI